MARGFFGPADVDEGQAEFLVNLRHAGIDLERLGVLLDGRLDLAAGLKSDAEVVVQRRRRRADLDGAFKPGLGLVEPSQPCEGLTEIIQGVHKTRIDLKGLFEAGYGFI